MNRYQNMMEQVPIPAGQAGRLKAAVLAAEPEKKRRVYRPRSLAKKLLLAAALALALAVTAGAAGEIVPWDQIFVERFGEDASAAPVAEDVFQNVDTVSVCGDVTLTVRQAIGAEKTLYLLLDYQLPESADIEAVVAAWEQQEGPSCARVEFLGGGEADWADIEGLDAQQVGRLFKERFGYSGVTETLEFDRETRTLTYMISASFLDKIPSRKALTLLVEPPEIRVGEEYMPLADHSAIVTFQPSWTARTKTGRTTNGGVTYTVELSPLSVAVKASGEKSAIPSGLMLRQKTVLLYRDGTEVPVKTLGPDCGYGEGFSGFVYYTSCTAMFRKFVDTSAVRAVCVGDAEIPLF